MKKFYTLLLLCTAGTGYSQQGFGTSNPAPSSVIDMVASNKGALLPRVTLTSTSVAAPVPLPANALTVFNTATTGDVTPGYYYWSSADSKWIRLLNQNDITEPWRVQATTNQATTNTQDIYQTGKVAIGPGFDAAATTKQLEVAGGFKAAALQGGVIAGIETANTDDPDIKNVMVVMEDGADLGVSGKGSFYVNDLNQIGIGIFDDANRSVSQYTMNSIISNKITGTNEAFTTLENKHVSIGSMETSTTNGVTIEINYDNGITFNHGSNLNPSATFYKFPTNNGAPNQVLVTNGNTSNATLSWQDVSTIAPEVDGVIGNEVTNATTNGGLERAGAGTNADPYTLGMTPGTTSGDLMTWDGTAWNPAAANNIYNTDGTLTNNRTLTIDGKSLNFLGSDQLTQWGSFGYFYQMGLDSSPYGNASMAFLSADKDSNGKNSRMDIQAFPEAEAQITANGDATALALQTSTTTNSAPITFTTSAGGDALGTEKMRITGEGNLGINTITPTENFHVAGNARIESLPLDGTTNTIFTTPAGDASSTKDQTFTATKTVVADDNGVLGSITGVPLTTEVDGVIGNEVTDATTNGGLTRAGTGTNADPYTLGLTSGTSTGDLMTWDGTAWTPSPAVNIYNANGTLTSERTLNFNTHGLTFTGDNQQTNFSDDGLRQIGITDHAAIQLQNADLDANGSSTYMNLYTFADNYAEISTTGDTNGLMFSAEGEINPAVLEFRTSSGGGVPSLQRLLITGDGNIGINTDSPSESLDNNNGSTRLRYLPLNGATNAIFTTSAGDASSSQDQTFTATKTVVADDNGVLGSIAGIPLTTEADAVIGNEVTNATTNGGLTRTGSGTNASPYTLGLTPGTSTGQLMTWNGTAWNPAAPAAEVDAVIGNEVTNATTNGGLTRAGAGTNVSPYTLGLTSGTSTGQLMTWNGTAWNPAAPTVTNIYNTDGTLTGNRILSQNGSTLKFSNGTGQSTTFNNTTASGIEQRPGSTGRANMRFYDSSDAMSFTLYTDNNSASQMYSVGSSTSLVLGTHLTTGATGAPLSFVTSAGSGAAGTEKMRITPTGSVGIGTSSPNASAIVDIDVSSLATGSKKGFLGPRVALTSRTDATTIPSPAAGLLAYNLGTGGLTYAGYVYWDGTEWRAMVNSSLAAGTIGSLSCSSATLSPSSYTSGVAYTGTMSVPYTGGNGGTYSAQSIGPVNGLTATLSAGNFANGAGTLNYTVTGTPTVTSPVTTTFALSIGGQSCNAAIGTGDTISTGQEVYWYGEASANIGSGGLNATTSLAANYLSNYATDVPVMDGMRFDFYFIAPVTAAGTISGIPRLVNVSGGNLKVNFSAMSSVENYGSSNIILGPSDFINLDNGIYNGYGQNMTTSSTPASYTSPSTTHTEIETVDLWVNNHWYRATYYPVIDNNNTTGATDDIRKIAISIKRLK